MNEREIAFLQSLTKTVDLCTKKSADFANLPAFTEQVTQLNQIVLAIKQEIQKLEVSSQGFTQAKNTAKENLMQLTLQLVKRVQAYAAITLDQVLLNEVNLNSSDLIKLHESLLGTSCHRILSRSQERADSLLPYNVTAEMLTAFEAAIADFESKLVETPQYRGEQKAAKLKVEQLFEEAHAIVKLKLDRLVEIIKDSNYGTYVEYKNTRKLELKAGRTMSLKGRVFDAATSEAIQGATVIILKNGNGDTQAANGTEFSKLVKKTADRGGFQINSLPAGTYKITATKEGYSELTVTTYINDNELSQVEIPLTGL